jgi:molybdopterin synthase sulfur carrier subunit
MIKVLLFAGIAEKIGQNELFIPEENLKVVQVIAWLQQQYPELKEELAQSMIAVNEEFASLDQQVSTRDVVAIIPPVSGG